MSRAAAEVVWMYHWLYKGLLTQPSQSTWPSDDLQIDSHQHLGGSGHSLSLVYIIEMLWLTDLGLSLNSKICMCLARQLHSLILNITTHCILRT